MKRIFTLAAACLIISLKLNAQNCIDTVHIKGYFVVQKVASELSPDIHRNGNVTVIANRIDVHQNPSFIPCDSINNKHPLSYWLNHFFDSTRQVFISCERIALKYMLSNDCLSQVDNKSDSCRFPVLQSKILYQTTNLNTGEVFEIYYLDAYWAKIKIKKGTIQETMIPSRIAETAIEAGIKEYDLYYFVSYDMINTAPKINDSNIRVWKR